jgi:hypothetical protein
MEQKKRTHADPCGRRATPKQMIAYLSYALEDVRVLSPRSMVYLANAIAALAEDTQPGPEAGLQSVENSLSIH